MRRSVIGVLVAMTFLVLSSPAGAQTGRTGGGGGSTADTVPKSAMPPAGMCRVWITGVKPAQQSAVTDCATAVRNVPPNGRVIWGDTAAKAKPPVVPPGGKVPPPGTKTNPIKVLPPPPKPPPESDTLALPRTW